jgi:23S rRNA (adenine2030-N6)-methyltransferase
MPYLVQVLGKDAGARFTIETGTQVTGAASARLAGEGPRAPVGNARRASPLSGKGSLRLPGEKMVREGEEAAPAAPKTGARRVWRPDGSAQGKPQAGGQGEGRGPGKRPSAAGGATGARSAAPRALAPRADGPRTAGPRPAGPRTGGKGGGKR